MHMYTYVPMYQIKAKVLTIQVGKAPFIFPKPFKQYSLMFPFNLHTQCTLYIYLVLWIAWLQLRQISIPF